MFINDDFLLKTDMAKKLYHEHSEEQAIIDYHCHLSPEEIATDKRYKNITEIWLYGDHYKWRAMRSFGIEEKYITGDASDYEKFLEYAKMIPYTLGNPLYHWTHLELKRYFGIDTILSEKTAPEIWERANEVLNSKEFSAKQILNDFKVEVVCTTDDPTDDLKWHEEIKKDTELKTKVLPTFRPDRMVKFELADHADYLKKYEEVVGFEINTKDDLFKAMTLRLDYFEERGCKLADHGLDIMEYKPISTVEANTVEKVLAKLKFGEKISDEERVGFKSEIAHFLGKEYAKRGWTMQMHIGAKRNNNTRMFQKLGADVGFDSISDRLFIDALSSTLNDLEMENLLPKTIIYSLNPIYNYSVATMLGNFQGSGVRGKIQMGSGWWFNDQKDGMEEQMKSLANLGLLSNFVGMLTDSRSFLSYTRHEYFRRIMCNLIGDLVENGEYPADEEILGEIVEKISYKNAKEYFGF